MKLDIDEVAGVGVFSGRVKGSVCFVPTLSLIKVRANAYESQMSYMRQG